MIVAFFAASLGSGGVGESDCLRRAGLRHNHERLGLWSGGEVSAWRPFGGSVYCFCVRQGREFNL